MTDFGMLLRTYRKRCKDPDFPDRWLSQERLGELLGRQLDIRGGFSGAAISDWERRKSKIHVDDRLLLVSLLTVLHEQGGLEAVSEANELLYAGGYRALDLAEGQRIFHSPPEQTAASSDKKGYDHQNITSILWGTAFPVLNEELQASLLRAKEGPSPSWPRILIALFNTITARWSILHTLRVLLWLWTWLFAWGLIMPSLRWPFRIPEDAISAMRLYTGGTLVIPLLIGILTDTKNNEFWQRHNLASAVATRLYTYQGAFVGFHLGYFIAFIAGMFRYHILHGPTIWFELTTITLLLSLGYAGARLVPYNLWKAYGRLNLADGEIFFFFIAVGPMWGFLFLEFYPYLLTSITGLLIMLFSITFFIALAAWQNYQNRPTIIPFSWWIIFFVALIICQIIVFFLR
ncbi:MAG: hypothetical protein ACOYYU_18810 [Chloroflexota bacterium]